MRFNKISKISFFLIIVIAVTLFNLLLLNLPLTNILGYEFSVINGGLLSFIGGILYIHERDKINKTSNSYFAVISKKNIHFISLAVIPLVLAVGNTIILGNCPFSNSAYFYFVLSLPSYFIGTVLGYIVTVITEKYKYLLFSILFLIILFLPIIEIYLNPQVYFYTTILGYFPGNLYDEDLLVDLTLITYRLFNLIYFIGIVFFLQKVEIQRLLKKFLFIIVLIGIATIFTLVKPSLGFSSSKSSIKKELNRELKTEHFDIIYNGILSKTEVENLALHHEYYYDELKNELKAIPSKRIVSYIFKDNSQKRELFGAGNADVAKPWLYNIYTTYENYDSTLKHELAHVFAAEFGVTPFKVAYNINPSLIEGFAMMVEDDYDGNDIHYMAALAYNYGYSFPLTELFDGLTFFTQSSSAAYIISGSFIKYLKNKYGIEKTIQLYGDLDFEKHFSSNLSQLEENYNNFISKLKFNFNENEANLYFGRKPIFKRTCARYVAVQLKRGWQEYNNGAYQDAEGTFLEIFKYSESYSALVGYISSLIKTDKTLTALELLKEEIEKYENSSYYYDLELILADLFIRNDKYEKAREAYLDLIGIIPNTRYYINVTNRLFLLNESAELLKKYLTGSQFDKNRIISDIFLRTQNTQFIPALVTFSRMLDVNYNDFVEDIEPGIWGNDRISSYAAFRLTQLAVEKMDYIAAKQYCEIAITSAEMKNLEIYKRYLKKVNWLIENKNIIESKFEYSE